MACDPGVVYVAPAFVTAAFLAIAFICWNR
jgi:hypothetical protein